MGNPCIVTHHAMNEVVFVKIHVNEVMLKIVTAYRTTELDANENVRFVNFFREKLENEYGYVLVGDFNYPNIYWENLTSSCSIENVFIEFINEYNLHQHVSTPTRDGNLLHLFISLDVDKCRQVPSVRRGLFLNKRSLHASHVVEYGLKYE